MLDPLIESIQALIQNVFRHELGTNEFYTVLGFALFGFLLAARLLVGLFGSKRGILLTSMGVLFPLLFGALGFALVEVYAVSKIEADWGAYMPGAAFGLVVIIGVLVLTRRFFDMNGFMAVVIMVLSLGAGVGGYFCSFSVVKFLDESSTSLEKRDQDLVDKIDSIDP